MNHSKYHRLRTDCQAAIGDSNLEKCFELLAESLDERKAAYNEYVQMRGRLSSLLSQWSLGLISNADYNLTLNQIRAGLLNFLDNTIKEEDVSLLRRIHDRILIVASKLNPAEWEKLFNEAYFSHARIIKYDDEIPEEFKSPDVVVFDNLYMKNHLGMRRYIRELPDAHYLYVSSKKDDNPLEAENPEAFERCANANSLITVPARLRELLEYRKIYGLP